MTTCKFGGTSLADASRIRKVKAILDADSSRKVLVVSAPGKRDKDDIKVTDLLYRSLEDPSEFSVIRQRFMEMAADLRVEGFDKVLDQAFDDMIREHRPDFSASRGEYLNARLISSFLGFEYLEAADLVNITSFSCPRITVDRPCCIGGFYGRDDSGKITTFSRGGSDITGSIMARATGSQLYENFTDVSGVYEADPRIISEARPIERLTYSQVKRLAQLGAGVFHPAAILPLAGSNMPIRVCNTMRPEDPGTLIEEQGLLFNGFKAIGLASTHEKPEAFGHRDHELYAGLVFEGSMPANLSLKVKELGLEATLTNDSLLIGLSSKADLKKIYDIFF